MSAIWHAEPQRVSVRSQDLTLNVLTLGKPDCPPLVMLHGIRDTAMGLVPVAELLADDWFVVMPDMRGHGDSHKPGHYAMPQFIYDLYRVIASMRLERPVIFGHSLGGHIVTRFAAQFPDVAPRLIIAEGLGPPRRPQDEKYDGPAEGQRLIAAMETPARMRSLPNLAFAAERLRVNNPRLTAERAQWLAEHSTAMDARGELHWKFDPRVGELWLSADHAQNEVRWRQITVPVLVITAGLAHEYWLGQMPIPGWSGKFSDDELASRLRCFANVEHAHIEDAGHMVHFDRPMELAALVRKFIEQ